MHIQGKKEKKGKKRKDPTSDRSIESLFAELVGGVGQEKEKEKEKTTQAKQARMTEQILCA